MKIDARGDISLRDIADAVERYKDTGVDTDIRAYKFVTADFMSPFASWPCWMLYRVSYALPIHYGIGSCHEVRNANTDAELTCGKGISVGTLGGCNMAVHWPDYGHQRTCCGMRLIAVEFKASDVAMINPSEWKFRLFRCKVVGEVDKAGKLIAWLWKGRVVRRHR